MSASVSAPRAFLPTLRRLDTELAIPLPDRLGVLRELEADLEELTDSFVARGHDLEVAREMAREALVPDGTTLGELRRIHSSAYARLSQRFGGSRLRVIERSSLVLATTGVMVVEAVALMGADPSYDPSPLMWPLLWLSGVLFAAIAATAFSLWVKKDHVAAKPGPQAILGLSALVLTAGVVGATVDLYLLAGSIEAVPTDAASRLLHGLRRDGALLSVSMLASMSGGLAWFVFTQWLFALGAARADTLGLAPDHHERKKGAPA